MFWLAGCWFACYWLMVDGRDNWGIASTLNFCFYLERIGNSAYKLTDSCNDSAYDDIH